MLARGGERRKCKVAFATAEVSEPAGQESVRGFEQEVTEEQREIYAAIKEWRFAIAD